MAGAHEPSSSRRGWGSPGGFSRALFPKANGQCIRYRSRYSSCSSESVCASASSHRESSPSHASATAARRSARPEGAGNASGSSAVE